MGLPELRRKNMRTAKVKAVTGRTQKGQFEPYDGELPTGEAAQVGLPRERRAGAEQHLLAPFAHRKA